MCFTVVERNKSTCHACVLVSLWSIRAADSQYTDGGSHRSVGPSYVIEVKAKSFLCSPWRHMGGGGWGVVTVIKLGTRRERVVSFTSRSLYSQGKRPRCPLNSWMVDHGAGLALYLLTACGRVLEKLTGFQLVKKYPHFMEPRRFITAFTSAHHLSLSWASSIQSVPPHPTSWKSILISSHLRLGLPSGLFPSGFPTKNLYTSHLSPIGATCPAHLILLALWRREISCPRREANHDFTDV